MKKWITAVAVVGALIASGLLTGCATGLGGAQVSLVMPFSNPAQHSAGTNYQTAHAIKVAGESGQPTKAFQNMAAEGESATFTADAEHQTTADLAGQAGRGQQTTTTSKAVDTSTSSPSNTTVTPSNTNPVAPNVNVTPATP